MASDNQIIAEIIVEGVDKFKADLKGAQGSVESLNSAIEKTGTESKEATSEATKSFESWRSQLKGMTSELTAMNLQLAEMKDAGKAGTKEFTDLEKKMSDLQKKAGNLKDAMGDAAEQIKAAGSDTSGLDKAIRTVSSATAAFQIFEGVAAVAGSTNEDLQKALVKLNGVMAITQGLQQIQNELVRQDSVFKKVAAVATAGYNLVVGQSTGALKLFRIALASTGIGLLVIGIATLIANFDTLKNSGGLVGQALRKIGDVVDTVVGKLKDFTDWLGLTQFAQDEAAEAQKKYQEALKETQKKIEEDNKKKAQLANEAAEQAKKDAAEQLAIQQKLTADYLKTLENRRNLEVEIKRNEIELAKQLNAEKNKERMDQRKRELDMQKQELADLKKAEEEKAAAIIAAQRERKDAEFVPATREDQLAEMFQKAQNYYSQIQSVINQTMDVVSNATQLRAQNEIAALDKKRQRGLITEKQYEKQVSKIKNEEAKKNKIARTIEAFAMIPMAILNALTSIPFPANIAAAAVVGALATAQAAIVAASPLPKFREGGSVAKRLGLIRGKSHEQGGVPIEVEGDEFVMSKKAVKHYGVDFMDRVNKMKLSPVVTMQAKMDHIKNTDYKLYEHLATLGGYMKQDYRANENGNNILLGIKEALKRNNTYV